MFCPKCGRENSPGQHFCVYCGTELTAVPSRSASSPVPKFWRAIGAVIRVLLYVGILMGCQSCVASGFVISKISEGGIGVPSLEDAAAHSTELFAYVEKTIAENLTALTLVSGLVTILIVCLLQTLRRRNLSDALMVHHVNPFRFPMFALFGAALSIFVSVTLSLLPLPASLLDSLEETYAPIADASPALAFISVALVGGIVEELIFRGIALTRLQKFGNGFAVVVSALIFGWAHGTVLAIVYAALIGVVFALLAIRYRSILPGMICHIAFNAVGIIPMPDTPSFIYPLYVLSIAVLILGIFRIFIRYPTFSDVALDRDCLITARDETENGIFTRIREIRKNGDATPAELESLRDAWENNQKNRKNNRSGH